ncbi:MAG: hypothetical protein CM15mP102_05040 [Flavobacteriales bacterium]|nr:MAG: hypothetical protein CM15mP102_05040 [Flavobacteriales bacterium]
MFNPITSFFFKFLGEFQLTEQKNLKIVDEVVDLFKLDKIKILAIAPEGTRKELKNGKQDFII